MKDVKQKNLLRSLGDDKEINWDDYFENPKSALDNLREMSNPQFENLPTVSCQANNVIMVQFMAEPEIRCDKEGKEHAFAELIVLTKTEGWDRTQKREITLKAGTKASMDLKRHGGLWAIMGKMTPITNKAFVIGNLGKVPVKKGSAYNYKIQEIPTEKIPKF